MSTIAPEETVLYKVLRFDPDNDSAPRWQEFTLPVTPGMTVLDGLWAIKETVDASLAWRSSCRMGICGSCAMWINGKPRLGCNTQIAELGKGTVEVAPLPNFDTIRDLVPDLMSMFDHHAGLSPYILRDNQEEQLEPTGEYYQSAEELEAFMQFTFCIKCGCCVAACPTCASDPTYSGPMALTQAHRYNTDSRDDGFDLRKMALSGELGPWRCHFAGECSAVCPKGVDPGKAIQLMRRALVLDALGMRKKRSPAGLATVPPGTQRRPDVPDAPPKTV